MQNDSNDSLVLHRYAENAYLDYAVATVKGRALAQVQDGLKPVQRRILFAMSQLGLKHPAKYVKSARVVGDVLGKYHPHGDSAAYEAMVRMAQGFSLRYPLIDGQGNFGSRDGDSAAAMRYTEARLTPIADLLLSELAYGTVDFKPNYDGHFDEPVLLPSRLPFLLLNGTSGIAVGLAADIPPHNAREVSKAAVEILNNPSATLDDILEHILGPDFPDGGQLSSTKDEVRAAYESGNGTLRMRARWVKEDLARGQWQLVITELPYQVSTKTILQELDKLINPSIPSGKKTLTQAQTNLKTTIVELLEKAVDESDKSNPVRLVLSPKSSKIPPDTLISFLLANTSLETTVKLNFNVISMRGKPESLGLLELLQSWVNFRLETVRRRTEHELAAANARIHVLEGRLQVYLNLDEVIKVIRYADEPKIELISRFGLSEIQAEDILEMRLRQLNNLEGDKLKHELDKLKAAARGLEALLKSDKLMRQLVIKELEADTAKVGDDRRTLIKPEAKAAPAQVAPSAAEEPLTVVLSKNLWLRAYKGHDVSTDSMSFKQGDSALHIVRLRTNDILVLLDTKGRIYNIPASQVPSGRGEGAPLSTFIELPPGSSPLSMFNAEESKQYLFSMTSGYGFIAPSKSLYTRLKAGKSFVDVEGSTLLPIRQLQGSTEYAFCVASNGKNLMFSTSEIKTLQNGGKGVLLIDLADNAHLEAIFVVENLEILGKTKWEAVGLENNRSMKVTLDAETIQAVLGKRARKGVFLSKKAVLKERCDS